MCKYVYISEALLSLTICYPKRSHELALIQIGGYLKGTLDKGLIFTPIDAESLRTDVYVDAAFACGWGTELGTNPDSVKS